MLRLLPLTAVTPVAFALVWAISGSKVVAQTPIEPARQARIDGLVAQLGDQEYAAREAAGRELLSIGVDARPAMLKALQNPDPEIRARCRRLVPLIEAHFCWDRARRILGDSPAARREFLEMYATERELWYALAEGDADLGKKYAARCSELAAGPLTRKFPLGAPTEVVDPSRYDLREGRLATLLVIGAECRSRIPGDSLLLATRLFIRQWGGQYAKNTPPFLRKSYVTWAEEVAPLPVEYEGDKKLERARGALRSSTVPARERQYALLTVARALDKRDDELIRGFLTDDAVCDTLFSKGFRTQVRLRDVALAATIYRAGKDPIPFGFTKLKSAPDLIYRPSSLGFADDDSRAKAFRAWNGAVGMSR